MKALYYNLDNFIQYTTGGGIITPYEVTSSGRKDVGVNIINDSISNTSSRAYLKLDFYNTHIFDEFTLQFKAKGTGKLFVALETSGGVRRQEEWIDLSEKDVNVKLKFVAGKNATHTIILGGVGKHQVNAIISNIFVLTTAPHLLDFIGNKELIGCVQSKSSGTFEPRNDLGINEIESITHNTYDIVVKFKKELNKKGVAFATIRHVGAGCRYMVQCDPVNNSTVSLKFEKNFTGSFLNVNEIESNVYVDIVYKC